MHLQKNFPFFAILVIHNALAIILISSLELRYLFWKWVSVLESTHHFNYHQQMTCLSTTKCLPDQLKEQTWHLRPNYYFYLDVACSGNCGGIFFNLYNDEKVLISI